jgi:hypothetical protein
MDMATRNGQELPRQQQRRLRAGRVAYVLDEWNLPKPTPGGEWALDAKFNAAEELLRDPALKDVLKTAIDKGCVIVPAPLPNVLDSRD